MFTIAEKREDERKVLERKMAVGATKIGFFLAFFVVGATLFTSGAEALAGNQLNSDRDEYEDVPDTPFSGKVQIMPIVQRDTKHKDVSVTVEEIIRELPNDEQYERIGKMLNNSYDAITREVAEGKNAYQQKKAIVAEKTNSAERMMIGVVFSVILLV
uniref:Uncharacterized protein n=1 Tax=Caenorhabditis japonica TaxID=281687 RepID=A0A8R1HPC3_CAEJA